MAARKSIHKETYNKGTYFSDTSQLESYLKQKGVVVYLLAADRYDDGTESYTVKIDNIKVD